jgi:MHS family proline/betaine transporter-like MFS transporter
MAQATSTPQKTNIWSVITASSVGTLIEWYDFYIFGSLATILAGKFFPSDNPTAAFLSTLATFAAGFIVRPFGALVFGRLGDLVGRKYTFLLTLVLMGGSTFLIGCVPSYASIGGWAPALVLLLRLVQGLALGGEYGGAATYVAEHSPAHRRGFYTSWIQTTATLGLFVSLGVILLVRQAVGVEEFTNGDGWRIPFLLSSLLVAISIYIRLKMSESPLFSKLKKEGKTSKNPLRESFGKRENLKMVLLALFGATAGQGVIWYTGQFYAQTFILRTSQIEYVQANTIIAVALILATPFFVVFGAWSDRVGRKWIMLAGMLAGILLYRPIYQQMYALADVSTKSPVPALEQLNTQRVLDRTGQDSLVTTTTTTFFSDSTQLREVKKTNRLVATAKPILTREITLSNAGFWAMVLLIAVQVLFVTMVYGPIAAFLVELFPTRIRYTSMSLPYHIGNGVFGGLTPFIATRLVEATKPTLEAPAADPFAGLVYPIAVAALCFVIGAVFLPSRIDEDVSD